MTRTTKTVPSNAQLTGLLNRLLKEILNSWCTGDSCAAGVPLLRRRPTQRTARAGFLCVLAVAEWRLAYKGAPLFSLFAYLYGLLVFISPRHTRELRRFLSARLSESTQTRAQTTLQTSRDYFLSGSNGSLNFRLDICC